MNGIHKEKDSELNNEWHSLTLLVNEYLNIHELFVNATANVGRCFRAYTWRCALRHFAKSL